MSFRQATGLCVLLMKYFEVSSSTGNMLKNITIVDYIVMSILYRGFEESQCGKFCCNCYVVNRKFMGVKKLMLRGRC